MGALPQDVLDTIINMIDTQTKILLYDSKVLHDLVSLTMYKNIEEDIFAEFKVQHNKQLQSCLNCLQYHVWSDGTPMKNRCRHFYKIVRGRTRIRAEWQVHCSQTQQKRTLHHGNNNYFNKK